MRASCWYQTAGRASVRRSGDSESGKRQAGLTGRIRAHREVRVLAAEAPDDFARRRADVVDGRRSAHRHEVVAVGADLCGRVDLRATARQFHPAAVGGRAEGNDARGSSQRGSLTSCRCRSADVLGTVSPCQPGLQQEEGKRGTHHLKVRLARTDASLERAPLEEQLVLLATVAERNLLEDTVPGPAVGRAARARQVRLCDAPRLDERSVVVGEDELLRGSGQVR